MMSLLLLVGQQNTRETQIRVKRSQVMSVEMQSCAMCDDYDKEIKIAVGGNELDLSSRRIKHDIIPLTFLLYQ